MSEWISVKDRLPNIGVRGVYASDYLLGYDGEQVTQVVYVAIKRSYWKELYTDQEVPITHWMPLPDPPQEATDET